MRDRKNLEIIKNFIDSTYSNFGNKLLVDTTKKYEPGVNDLGFCYKYTDPSSGSVVYRIECSKIGIERTDFRILMHEYGHIYKGHLDGIHEELDSLIAKVFNESRAEIIDLINSECGIDFADRLIERVLDDPEMNHALHNIAMDMEVNSSVLSEDDINEMEADITSVLPKYELEALEGAINEAKSEEYKKALSDALQKMKKEAMVKLIHPYRYHMGVDPVTSEPIPFPDNLTYADYLILIIRRLDQFVKMLVSIQMGGNGDTSDITQEDIQNALSGMFQRMQQRMSASQQSEAYRQGYKQALRDHRAGQTPQQQIDQALSGKSDEYKEGFSQGLQDQIPDSQDYKDGKQDGKEGKDPKEGGSQDYKDGHEAGQREKSSEENPGDYSNGYQDGKKMAENQKQKSSPGDGDQEMQDYNQGYQDALEDLQNQGSNDGMQSLSDMMEGAGMTQAPDSDSSDSKHNKPDPGQKKGEGREQKDTLNPFEGTGSETKKDHWTESREHADELRKEGKIQAGGGVGCSKSGNPEGTREVDKFVDDVDMALNEVINDVRNKVIKEQSTRDMMKLYNRGILRTVIAPSIVRKVTITTNPKLVFLIDISGSMDTRLIDRILKTISKSLSKINRDLRYDIITWSTCLGDHIKDVNPRKSIPRISYGGGTDMASGMEYFKAHYGPEAILVLISDFEDSLDQWHRVEQTMPKYTMWGFNYGNNRYSYKRGDWDWKYFRQRNFSDYGYDD